MKEILPGVFHWTTFHEGIGVDVHSYYIAAVDPAVLIDPRVPGEGLRWFREYPRPAHVYLTNRLHFRHSDRFVKQFGCKVWCHRTGLGQFRGTRNKVKAFEHGEELPGAVLALEVGALCPEETALFVPRAGGILAIGDAIIRRGSRLGFVPDAYMGDDPEAVKRGLARAFRRHLRRRFDHLLFAHGKPIVGGAKEKLRRFLDGLEA